MSTELAKGQNLALTGRRFAVQVRVERPVTVAALLVTPDGRGRVAAGEPGAHVAGASLLDVDLDALPADVAAVLCAVVAEDLPLGVGAPPRITVGEVADFTVGGLTDEQALVAVEFYRRDGGWKVRAVGQGYAGGLAALLAAHGVEESAAAPGDAPAVQPPDRLYAQVWAIYEDAARSAAALRSATDFATRRRDDQLSAAVADLAARTSPAGAAERARIEAAYDELMRRARADHQRDLGQLTTELRGVETALPAPMARWGAPAWSGWTGPGGFAQGVRVGELHADEAPELRIPMLVGLPARRPIWIDTSGQPAGGALAARALATRLLAATPLGLLRVESADLGGRSGPLAGLASSLAPAPAASPAELAALVASLAERVELVTVARQAGQHDLVDRGERLLVLHDFPYGVDDASAGRLRYLVEEGPAAGVTVVFVADASDAEGHGPLVSSLFREALRLPVVPDDHIADPWVGLGWNYTPDARPDTAAAIEMALARIAAASPA